VRASISGNATYGQPIEAEEVVLHLALTEIQFLSIFAKATGTRPIDGGP
jgi:hypothetical protein